MARVLDFLRGNEGVASDAVTVEEFGDQYQHTTILTLTGDAAVFPDITGGAAQGVGTLLYTFPAGNVVVHSAAFDSVAITQTDGNITNDTPDVGLGTREANTGFPTLSPPATENIITGQTFTDCNGTAEDVLVAQELIISADDDHTVYLNAADNWASGGDDGAVLSGRVIIRWSYLEGA